MIKLYFIPLLFLLTLRTPATPESGISLKQLEGLTAQWIALRTTLSDEARVWESRKQQWQREIQLLQEESELLEKEIQAHREVLSEADAQREQMQADSEQISASLKALDLVVERGVAQLQSFAGNLPASLKDASLFAALSPSQTSRIQTAQRLVAQLTHVEAMQPVFHVTSERIIHQGQVRRVQVLYCGLAFAWAVSPDGEWAGTGTPQADGWVWTEGGVDPAVVQNALAMAQQQTPASLIPLPLQLGEDSE